MPQRRILLLNPVGLTAYRINGASLISERHFATGQDGWMAFGEYLAQHPRSLFMLLVDVPEEGFQLEEVPFSRGQDRMAIIKRKLGQYFYGTPFSLAHSEGRLKTGRRDERLLLMALTQPQTLEPWLMILDEARASLAGIYSLPQVISRLLPADAPPQQLLILPTKAGLRQSFFDGRQLRFSRLTSLATDNTQESALAAVLEAGKIHQYLSSQRLIDRNRPLATRILVHPEQLTAMRERCQDSAALHFEIDDLVQEEIRLGLRTTEPSHTIDLLCCHLLARTTPAEQFALPPQRHFFRLWQTRFSLQAAGAAILTGGLLFAGKQLLDVSQLDATRLQIEQQVRTEQRHYDATLQSLPKIPLSADNLRALTERFDLLDRRAQGPRPLLMQLSRALDAFPDIALDKLEWKIVEQAPAGGTAVAGVTAAPPTGPGPYAQLEIDARLPLALAGAQSAQLERVTRFIRHLGDVTGAHVAALQLPVDLASTKLLKSGDIRATPEAPRFSLRLTRHI